VVERGPCLVGVAQRTVRPGDGPAPEPLELWAAAARDAVTDSGATGDVLRALDSVQVVYCQSWQYDDPVGRLCGALGDGVSPAHRLYSGIGGTTPQVLVNETAERMQRGELDVALIVGAEALETKRQLKKAGEKPPWSFPDPDKKPFPFEAPFHPAEVAHEVFQAWLTFTLWDVARRASLGVAPDDYRRSLGELLAPMTSIASRNPHAWFPVERTVDDVLTARPDNRMVAYPYTKYMVSVMDVDMAAALVLATDAAADALGVPAERRVYLRGSAYATDPTYVAEHRWFDRSPAMAAASSEALRLAGVDVDDVSYFDLYSCFTSSVLFACDALGLSPSSDARALTVTGGLPFAGGPGSGYLLHSIATMAESLRADPGSVGLVSGVGMHMTKHVFGVWSTTPNSGAAAAPVTPSSAIGPVGEPVPITATYSGPATVCTYTVVHARDGAPEWGLAICELGDGSRCYARVDDPDLLATMESTEWVGTPVQLVADGRVNRVEG
jgi:acetyl-CoA C-acetyltransferase